MPFAGEFGDTDVGLFAAVSNLLRNGFVRALNEGLEGSVAPEPLGAAAAESADARKDGGGS